MENTMEVPYKPKNRTTIWSCNSTSEHMPRKKNVIQKDTCTLVFKAALFTIPRTWKQPYCLYVHQQKNIVHTHNGILLSHRKEWNWVICRDVDRPKEDHTEWSKSEREK